MLERGTWLIERLILTCTYLQMCYWWLRMVMSALHHCRSWRGPAADGRGGCQRARSGRPPPHSAISHSYGSCVCHVIKSCDKKLYYMVMWPNLLYARNLVFRIFNLCEIATCTCTCTCMYMYTQNIYCGIEVKLIKRVGCTCVINFVYPITLSVYHSSPKEW